MRLNTRTLHAQAPHRTSWLACALIACACMLFGCEDKRVIINPAPPEPEARTVAEPIPTLPKIVVASSAPDLLDPAKYPHAKRVVSLAPNLTEVLFAIDAGDRVVGVTRFCDYPPEALASIPKVGGFIDPDFEAILARKPDLVVGIATGDKKIVASLDKARIPYLFMHTDTIADTYQAITLLGQALGKTKESTRLNTEIRTKLDLFSREAKARRAIEFGEQGRPSALFVVGKKPVMVAGKGTFADELLTLAHVQNASAQPNYPQLDMEKLLQLDPDIILDTAMTPNKADGRDDPFWQTPAARALKATKNGRVRPLNDPALLRAGPRLPVALSRLVDALYPPPSVP